MRAAAAISDTEKSRSGSRSTAANSPANGRVPAIRAEIAGHSAFAKAETASQTAACTAETTSRPAAFPAPERARNASRHRGAEPPCSRQARSGSGTERIESRKWTLTTHSPGSWQWRISRPGGRSAHVPGSSGTCESASATNPASGPVSST